MLRTNSMGVETVCRCGYNFVASRLANDRAFESYAIVNNRDYQEFLSREMRRLGATGERSKLKATAHSAEIVGSAMVCPDCSRLHVVTSEFARVYQLES